MQWRANHAGAALARRLALGPVVSFRLGRAENRSRWERSACESGRAEAAAAFEAHSTAFGAVQTMVAGAAAVLAAISFPHSLALRALIGGLAGLFAWWSVPTGWAIILALSAPVRQRNEAREFREWVRRRFQIKRERHQLDADIAACSVENKADLRAHFAENWVPERFSVYATWLREWRLPDHARAMEERSAPSDFSSAADAMQAALVSLDVATRDPRFWTEKEPW